MALVNNPVMGVNVRKNQNMKNTGYGKYYPEVDLQPTLSLRGFAQHMIDHGTIYGRDVLEGVLIKITECLPELVAQGIPVQLGGLGIFRPTITVNKPAQNLAALEGMNPSELVKAVHIRFIPDQTKLDNLAGPAFKDACSLELRNIVESVKMTVDGKEKRYQKLTPLDTAIAESKQPTSGD